MEIGYFLDNLNTPNILIGRFCSLADKIYFSIGGNHPYKNVSSFPFDSASVVTNLFGDNKAATTCIRPNHFQIIIGHDVWIARGAMIMSGIKVGNPARVIKYRFDAATIKKFLAVKWWNWSLEKIADNLPLMTDVEKFLSTHYTPALENFFADDVGKQIANLRAQGRKVYNFIADFGVVHPLWLRVVLGFCRSNFADSVLVIWLGKDSTERDFELLSEAVQIFSDGAAKNIIVAETQGDLNFSPYALRQGTHFITTREMSTLEALDYLWGTDVKIVSALDDGIFDNEPPVEWQAL